MGSGMSFMEEARAAYAAHVLRDHGHAVRWEKVYPHVVLTALDRDATRALLRDHPGVAEDWWELPDIDTRRTA